MKFRNLNTGKLFDNINDARRNYCPYKGGFPCPESCNLSAASNGGTSKCNLIWLEENKREAAHLMGYEVIEDDEPKEKPHICEVLGVEVGDKFTFPYPNKVYDECFVREDGTLWSRNSRTKDVNRIGAQAICWLINHVDTAQKLNAGAQAIRWLINRVETIQIPCELTDKELEICRALGAKWISRDKGGMYFSSVIFWDKKPEERSGCYVNANIIATVKSDKFPSVNPGERLYLRGGIEP